MAPPAALTCSSSDVLCAPDFLSSTAPVVTAFSHDASTAPATPNASACPGAMPPDDGSVATGDCDVTPAAFTYVPNAFPCVHVADGDLDVVVADTRLVDIARVIDFEDHVLERALVACVEPARSAEPAAPGIVKGLVGRGREVRDAAVEREAAPEFVRVVFVPLDVAAAVGRRARTAGAGLETERREVVRLRRVLLVAQMIALVNASAARQAEVGALIPSLVVLGPRGQDARGDGTLRTRGVVARYGNKHRRDRRQRQREMSRVVHENSSFWCTAVRAHSLT